MSNNAKELCAKSANEAAGKICKIAFLNHRVYINILIAAEDSMKLLDELEKCMHSFSPVRKIVNPLPN